MQKPAAKQAAVRVKRFGVLSAINNDNSDACRYEGDCLHKKR